VPPGSSETATRTQNRSETATPVLFETTALLGMILQIYAVRCRIVTVATRRCA
jgi:hypothetical protein